MIPHSEQGKLLGFAGAMGNIIAIGSSYLIGTILKKVSFPYNYTIIFAIGILILLLDVVDFQLMKEMPDEITDKQMNFFEYIKDIPNILRNNTNVLKIVIGNCFIIISNVSLGYYALYAIRTYNAQAEQVALFTGIAVTVNILGSAAFGLMADRFGHKSVLKIASMLGGIAGVIVLGIPSIYAVYIAFALSTLCLNGYNLSSGVIIVHNSPKTQVPVYISANNMITLIVSSVAMVASGYIIDKVSFTPIFMVIGFAGFIGFIVFNIISVNR
jgi:Na+/melibiose symporter-like transporter